MSGHQFQKLKIGEALFYLEQVKYKFKDQPKVFMDFLDILNEFKCQSINRFVVIHRVCNLFRGHPDLIVGFNTFVPLSYRIDVQRNKQMQVDIPDKNIGSGVITESTSLKILPAGSLSTSPVHSSHTSQSNHTTSPHSSLGSAVNKICGETSFLKIEDALSYLAEVKYKFVDQPQVYNEFLNIFKEFKTHQSINLPTVIQRICNLFRDHPYLITAFNAFLPLGRRIEVQQNEEMQDGKPGTNIVSGVITEPTLLKILPGGSPSTSPIDLSRISQSIHSNPTSPHSSPGNAVNKSQHVYMQNCPVHTRSNGGSPGVHSPNQSPVPVFDVAINYVRKVKNRFQGQPDIFKKFLDILHTFKKEQINIRDGVHIGGKLWTHAEVYAQFAELFQNEDDLIEGYFQFVPDSFAASALVELWLSSDQ